jgi:curli biogenesis system outer membrane secretion channel CsgG
MAPNKDSYRLLAWFLILVVLTISQPPMTCAQESIPSLARLLASKIPGTTKRVIAVADFSDIRGNVSDLGRQFAEEFSAALVDAASGFEVVDRAHLSVIMKEHRFQASQLVNPETAKQVGMFVGADGLITGTITPMTEYVRVVVKLLNVTTARIVASVTGDIPKTKTMEEMLAGNPGAPPGEAGGKETESKGLPIGKKVMFDEVSCQSPDGRVRIDLISMNIVDKGRPQFDFILRIKGGVSSVGIQSAHEKIYLATAQGEQIGFHSCTGLDGTKFKELQYDVPYRFSMVFAKMPPSGEEFSIVLSLTWFGFGNFDYLIRGVRLSK